MNHRGAAVLLCFAAMGAALIGGVGATTIRAQEPRLTGAELEQRLATYRRLLSDWGGLTRYGSEDSELKAPAPGEHRVVFLGDQITERWGSSGGQFFPGKPYLNRGIAGQTSPQMLVRFRQDVVALKPAVVIIQAGTNDMAGLTGPGTRGTWSDYMMSMAELARANGIRVVLASLTPVCDCSTTQTDRRPPAKIADWNQWLASYATTTGAIYLDYYSALVSGRNFRADLTADGLLPNATGYAVMGTLAEQAIDRALKR
jgi:lysophospholipase L1-like esterase